MAMNKKPYISPNIESERVDLPVAWACGEIPNAASGQICWSGDSITSLCTSFGVNGGDYRP